MTARAGNAHARSNRPRQRRPTAKGSPGWNTQTLQVAVRQPMNGHRVTGFYDESFLGDRQAQRGCGSPAAVAEPRAAGPFVTTIPALARASRLRKWLSQVRAHLPTHRRQDHIIHILSVLEKMRQTPPRRAPNRHAKTPLPGRTWHHYGVGLHKKSPVSPVHGCVVSYLVCGTQSESVPFLGFFFAQARGSFFAQVWKEDCSNL